MPKIVLTKEKKGESSIIKSAEGSKPIDLKIAYIGGGSRGWAHSLMNDLAQTIHFNGEVRLYDINYKMAEFNAKFGNWIQTNPKTVSNWKYRAVRDIKECLRGADFVFLSIQPGKIEDMGVDLLEPMKYGIYQPVGDTVGPGGHIRSLRTIKDYLFFAEAIKKYAPKAWCVNFTNPMTICTRTLYQGFPGIKAWGCCHEAFKAQHDMARLYAEKTGEKEPGREAINVNILGINHFTWINKAKYKGTDLFKMYLEHVNSPKVVNKFGKSKGIKKEQYFKSESQVCKILTKRFGAIAAAGDRHLAEFVPWFLLDKNSCRRWGFNLTPFSYRIKRFKEVPVQFAKTLKLGKHQDLYGSGEEYINQMMAVTGKTTFVTNVNLPNSGQHLGLPLGAVVETNAVFSSAGVSPVSSGALPDEITPLVLRHVINQETILKSVLTKNEDLAFRAFASDPLVGKIAFDDAWKLFKTMVKKTNFKFK
ncbi:MAG: alpha-glucosidase/alpha-galactosidase [Candidatus Firestonebacteria bacterium]